MNGTALPQLLKQGFVRLMVMDNTYGCVRHVEDLQRVDGGSKGPAVLSSAAKPKQIQVRSCSNPSALLSADTIPAHNFQSLRKSISFQKVAVRIICVSQSISSLCSLWSSSREG